MTQSWKIRGETIGGLSFYFTHKKCWENGKHLQFVVSLFVVGVLWSPLVWVLVGLFNRLGSRMVVEYCKEIRWASKRFHGWPSWKKSETVDASEIWGTPIHMATLPKTNSSHLKHWAWRMSFLLGWPPSSWRVLFHNPNRLAEFSSIKRQKQKRWRLWTLAFKGVPSTTRIFQKIATLIHVNESKVSPKALAIYDPLSPPAIFFQSAAKATPQQVPWHPCTCPGRSLASPRKSMRQRWFPNTRPLQLQKIMHHPCTCQTEHWGLFITKEHGHNVEPKVWQVLQTQHINHNQTG